MFYPKKYGDPNNDTIPIIGSSAFLVLNNKMLLMKMGLPERWRAFTAVANII
jgi:hypothetical protein